MSTRTVFTHFSGELLLGESSLEGILSVEFTEIGSPFVSAPNSIISTRFLWPKVGGPIRSHISL